MSGVVDNFLAELDWQEVAKDEYLSSDSETLGVDCLGTCLGLAVHDPKTGTGYLLHASTVGNEELESQVQEFVDELDQLSEPYEVLAGGTMASQYNPLDEEEFTHQARETVENVLDDGGISYQASWNDPPVYNRMIVSPDYGILYDRPEV
ncbi:hypothetical protein ACK3SF_00910 [Candidatus Nanosalina sp. VS9-1]|uniref:hypothetical protein n=1 Tax=Candidatus Nanosalina sp. VS9-1 TaxID=3388566 RepID=UPI0039DF9380